MTSAAPLGAVTAVLAALDLPDAQLAVEPWQHGAQVTVTWDGAAVDWKGPVSAGARSSAWRMVVRLDERHGRYSFTEYSSTTRRDAGVGVGSGLGATLEKRWHRGKSIGSFSRTTVVAPKVSTTTGGETTTGTSGTVRQRLGNLKVPVFQTLRAHGWRPRFDNWLTRATET